MRTEEAFETARGQIKSNRTVMRQNRDHLHDYVRDLQSQAGGEGGEYLNWWRQEMFHTRTAEDQYNTALDNMHNQEILSILGYQPQGQPPAEEPQEVPNEEQQEEQEQPGD